VKDEPTILLVDDDASFREVVTFHLDEEGLAVETADDGEAALERFDPARHAVVLTDLRMPRLDGMEVLRRIHSRSPTATVVVLTAFGTIEKAVEAMKAGAFDFIPKPCTRDHLKIVVRKALEHHRLHHRVDELEELVASGGQELVHTSARMAGLLELVDRTARSDATVLVTGESGTGKELVARRLHRKSARVRGPFVAVNCAAMPRDLLEAELFGHAAGAFTGATRRRRGRFELASGGTLLLDEVAEMPLDLQTKLLRALQERVIDVIGREQPLAVDVRVIAVTNRDLGAAVQDGSFRQDLFYRLNVIDLHVPPLRERREDILPLAEHFIRRFGGDRPLELSEATRRRLLQHDWPGNVRELENVCQRAALLTEDDLIEPDVLPPLEGPGGTAAPPAVVAGSEQVLELPAEGISLVDLERDVIIRALEMNGFNQAQTARFLRVPRHILLYRIQKHGITMPGR
jgi:two-component system NtrC family response regulator